MGYSKSRILNLIFSLSISLFIITSIIKFTVNFKQLYYFNIDYLNIPKLSNMTKEDIKLNYDYLIDYNTSNSDLDFNLPTLESSVQGKIHFEEVRDIFQNVKILTIITGIISIIGGIIQIRKKEFKFLRNSSILIIVMPVLLAIPIAINFNACFIMFHKIMFSNDYWIFNPEIDPVINMLPETFFMHMGVAILAIMLICSIVLQLIYRKLKTINYDNLK